ncbi:MAG: DUF6262 family protein [Acidimicrobiales bacterium]
MTDNSRALKRARRHDSNLKRRQARQTLQAMIDSGEPITFPAVARRAGVSVSLLYADGDLASRITDARHRQQQAGRQRAWRLPPRSLVTEQSLRVDLANAKDQLRRLTDEVTLLRDRLACELGADADVARGRTTSPLVEQLEERAADLEADNAQLRHRLVELERALEEANETVEAARAMNRELITELNRSGQAATQPAPPTRQAPRPRRSTRGKR